MNVRERVGINGQITTSVPLFRSVLISPATYASLIKIFEILFFVLPYYLALKNECNGI